MALAVSIEVVPPGGKGNLGDTDMIVKRAIEWDDRLEYAEAYWSIERMEAKKEAFVDAVKTSFKKATGKDYFVPEVTYGLR